jgi:hypothetical protein
VSGEDVPELNTGQAHSARVYDYLLGGKDNYAADRAAAEAALRVFPNARAAARANREFMHRAVRAVTELGVRQFLDIGTGIPTSPNLHQVAQGIDPACRVVYVDNDPIVLAHAAALMTSVPGGRTAYVQADAKDPGAVLAAPEVQATLDLDQPVALSLIAILHFIDDDEVAAGMVRGILEHLAPGSFLILTHATPDIAPEAISGSLAAYRSAGIRGRLRSRDELERLFLGGLDVLEPGIVVPQRWRAGAVEIGGLNDTDIPVYAAVARRA